LSLHYRDFTSPRFSPGGSQGMSSLGGIRNRFGHGGSQLHVRAHESVKTRQENPAGEEALTSRTRPAPASVSASAGSRLERRARPRAAPLLVAAGPDAVTRGRYRQLTRKRLLRRCAELDMGPAARGGAAGVAPATTRAPAMDWLGSGCLNYQKPRERARQSVTLSRLGPPPPPCKPPSHFTPPNNMST